MHLDQARTALGLLLDQLITGGLDQHCARASPGLPHSLTLLTIGWLFPMLDYVMTGDRRVGRVQKQFINQVLINNLSIHDLNEADSRLRRNSIAFDPSVLPAFLLIGERLQPGFCEQVYPYLDTLIQAAIAWDGEKCLEDMDRAEQVLEPIRRHFKLTVVTEQTSDQVKQQSRTTGAAMQELDSLIGLEAVKREVRNNCNFARYMLNRRENNLPVAPTSMHMVFTGNPGTGKTTVARLIADIYRDIGVLREGHLVETDRSGLVGKYVGQTPSQVREVVESALGGVLFIDEAYSLVVNRDAEDYGYEAVDTLLKMMEDHRDDLVVIVAGYTTEMQQFIKANPGLQSRFTRYIHFDDYSAPELMKIFLRLCKRHELKLQTDALNSSARAIKAIWSRRSEHFGNAREVRTFFEAVLQQHANRLSQIDKPSREQLCTLSQEDIPA